MGLHMMQHSTRQRVGWQLQASFKYARVSVALSADGRCNLALADAVLLAQQGRA